MVLRSRGRGRVGRRRTTCEAVEARILENLVLGCGPPVISAAVTGLLADARWPQPAAGPR